MKICVIGSLNIDHVVSVNNFAEPGQTIRANNYETYFGGKGGNQSVACRNLGLDVSLVASINPNDGGQIYLDHLRKLGVNTHLIKSSNIHSGYAFIEVESSGENKIVTAGGANYDLDMTWVKSCEEEILKHDIFLFSLEIPNDIVTYLLKLLDENDKIVILDPAPVANFTDEMLDYIDFITPNETEFLRLENRVIFKKTLKVIEKMGGRGSRLLYNDNEIVSTAYAVNAIDTVGAGDTFNAAVAYSVVNNYSHEIMLRFANICGALATTKKGAQSGMPEIDNIMKLL